MFARAQFRAFAGEGLAPMRSAAEGCGGELTGARVVGYRMDALR